jgi:hypothetical protein
VLGDRYLYAPESFREESREKLLNLLAKHKRSGVVFLSGDIHYTQMNQLMCPSVYGYTIPEFASSGLSHAIRHDPFRWKIPNYKFYVGDLAQLFTYPRMAQTEWNGDYLNFGSVNITKTEDDDILISATAFNKLDN